MKEAGVAERSLGVTVYSDYLSSPPIKRRKDTKSLSLGFDSIGLLALPGVFRSTFCHYKKHVACH